MVTFREALLVLVAVVACDTKRDNTDTHPFRNISAADFACLATLEGTIPCQDAGTCRASDRVSQVIVVDKTSCFYGVLSGHHVIAQFLNADALRWWGKGRRMTLLVIGNNGVQPGWTAPRQSPPDNPTSTVWIEPVCGLSTENPVATLSMYRTWIFDEAHQTYIEDMYLNSMFQNHAATGRDSDDNIVPDTIGSREIKEPIRNGWVIERERVEDDLVAAAGDPVDRHPFDPSRNTGTCVTER